jgi:hypothetical protein
MVKKVMAEASTYNFDLNEVTTALIKHQGIHDGSWILAVEFNFGAAFAGAAKEAVRPSAIVQVNKLQLVRQAESLEGRPAGVNAAEVNPEASQIKPAPTVRKTK